MVVAILLTFAAAPQVSIEVDQTSGAYSVALDGEKWYTSPPAPQVCVAGKQITLAFNKTSPASGTGHWGPWSGVEARYTSEKSPSVVLDLQFQSFHQQPSIAVAKASFPQGLDTSKCGGNKQLSANFPAFSTASARAAQLDTLSWRGGVIDTTVAARGLDKLGANGLDCGPVVSTDPATGATLVWSTLDNHKIVPQTTAGGTYAMGIAAAVPALPAGFAYSSLFSASGGGATAAVYAWGDRIQDFHSTTRLPSVTLTDVGYYTDDGAYYYVWGGGKELHDPQLSPWIPPRPWPAEEGLVLVKEALVKAGVPVAYMQLDDCAPARFELATSCSRAPSLLTWRL